MGCCKFTWGTNVNDTLYWFKLSKNSMEVIH